MGAAVTHWLHLLAVAVWIGAQVCLVIVVLPSLRTVQEPSLRHALLVVLVQRFNLLAWASLMLAIATGLLRAADIVPSLSLLTTTLYGRVLLAKGALVAAVVVLTALHAFLIGPRLLTLLEAGSASGATTYVELARWSRALAALTLLLSLATLVAAVALRWAPF